MQPSSPAAAPANPTLTIVSLRRSGRRTNRRRDAAQGDFKTKRLCRIWREPLSFCISARSIRPRREWPRRCHESPGRDCALGDRSDGTAQSDAKLLTSPWLVEDFIVQRREKLRETHLLFRRDLLKRVPEDISRRIEVQWRPIRSDRVCDS